MLDDRKRASTSAAAAIREAPHDSAAAWSGEWRPPPQRGPEALATLRARYLVPWARHYYRDPPQIVRGEMQYLFDHRGRRFLDFLAGVAVMNLGHSHPEVSAAAHAAVDALQHTTTIYLTQPLVDLAAALADAAPGDLSRSFFTTSGSEAVEAAALLASHATGGHEFIALRGGLHGRTKLGMSLTGLGMWRSDDAPVGGVSFAPAPDCFRCPFGATRSHCDLACARAVEDVIQSSTSRRPAAFIAEPLQGNGGIVDPPAGYFELIREILDRYGALLIADEVQTGLSRTGRLFAVEHHGVVPDVLVLAKALGNGYPIAAIVTRDAIASRSDRPGASTLGGSAFTASVALTVLTIHRRENLAARAARLGARLRDALDALAGEHPLIGDVRGRGLMLGAEIVKKDGRTPDPDAVDRILEGMKDRGVFVGKTGPNRNVLTFQPPLVVSEDDIDLTAGALRECLEVEARRSESGNAPAGARR